MGSTFQEIIQAVDIHMRELEGKAVAIDDTAWLHLFLKVTMHDTMGARGNLALIEKTCQVGILLHYFIFRL
jgi:hypothetical protein